MVEEGRKRNLKWQMAWSDSMQESPEAKEIRSKWKMWRRTNLDMTLTPGEFLLDNLRSQRHAASSRPSVGSRRFKKVGKKIYGTFTNLFTFFFFLHPVIWTGLGILWSVLTQTSQFVFASLHRYKKINPEFRKINNPGIML